MVKSELTPAHTWTNNLIHISSTNTKLWNLSIELLYYHFRLKLSTSVFMITGKCLTGIECTFKAKLECRWCVVYTCSGFGKVKFSPWSPLKGFKVRHIPGILTAQMGRPRDRLQSELEGVRYQVHQYNSSVNLTSLYIFLQQKFQMSPLHFLFPTIASNSMT